jgi:intraflagellar transport protein 80
MFLQCCIYAVTNWHIPQILDIDDSITLLKQCENCFLIVSGLAGLQLFTYGGRRLSNPKFQGN